MHERDQINDYSGFQVIVEPDLGLKGRASTLAAREGFTNSRSISTLELDPLKQQTFGENRGHTTQYVAK
ncbi:hypothetical protein E4U22_000345, partial [Claviceps purpurea]